ncbi:NADH-FMN oxidoreductase RutF, flavin reductase (DIM6/NTAB) family [Clostridium collagenovorans DSM 3089]|uniref:NADH-FMN oxidoreductase RutF, flavin reductase (DIM6/NTAB) family n=1 Tax=Clostridium collagenovorans DSM 3089 TaxID=1121306 RepID=A0A1M5TTT5_9CLOT|nr:flavin reductase family protein [Clostridium collagenovorans]SHH54091.1 NADH-FMN oxidoreductase RutF, flavin reductase (DIM6/NTAB) family [Clostridium collagenovorans DSM 3089]
MNFIENLELAMKNLHTQGAFLTVKSGDIVNTMTISWGQIGYQWNRPTFTVMVRKSRYTFDLIEKAKDFTVSIPVESDMKTSLGFCGTKSGRDIDKFKECNLSLKASNKVDTPIIDAKGVHYECKIVYKQEMSSEFLNEEIKESKYSDNDYHVLYFGEIVDCYLK